ncbi:MAG TPA: hypothetical protein VJ672_10370 [Gemmatimonadaceae bacterium]|nr:hypothetical protein [Gemmatimonadaceae bacterium]
MTRRMSNDVSTEQAVAALLAERQRYEAWLSALEAKRANTPVHIYQRVHADYSSRLQRVVEQLGTHRSAIQELANNLGDRLTSLDIDESKHRDERAEAEVRSAVGEMSKEEAATIIQRTDAELHRINAERSGITEELTRYRQMLEIGMEMPKPQRSAAAAPAAPAPAASSAPANAPVKTSFDELEFLNSVTRSNGGGAANRAASTQTSRDLGVPMIEHGGTMGLPEHGSSSIAADHSLETSLREMPGAPYIATEEPKSGPRATARESVPSFLKDMPPEQVKTLKCQECATLNYPTEWYCERCGAELAAL